MNKIGARSFHSFEAVGNLNSSASDLGGKKKTWREKRREKEKGRGGENNMKGHRKAENRTLEMTQMSYWLAYISVWVLPLF